MIIDIDFTIAFNDKERENGTDQIAKTGLQVK